MSARPEPIKSPAIEVVGVMGTPEIQAPVHLIRDPDDARPLDAAHVADLAVSIGDVGLDHPISLRLLKPEELGEDGCVWMRTRGGHRLAAVRLLGLPTINAKVRDQSDEVAAIAEVDENLIRRDLNPLERAQAFASRLEAWAALNPDRVQTEDGMVRAKRGRPQKGGNLPHFTMGFTPDTARKAGVSPDVVKRSLTIYRAIPPSQQARLHGTWLADNGSVLRQLAALADPAEQAAVIEVLLAGKTKNVANARAIAAGNAPIEGAKTASNRDEAEIKRLWNRTTPSVRAAVLEWLSGRPLPKPYLVSKVSE